MEDQSIVLSNGAQVPVGPIHRVDIEENKRIAEIEDEEERKKEENKLIKLDYNQYVVYDESQIRIRYLVQLEV